MRFVIIVTHTNNSIGKKEASTKISPLTIDTLAHPVRIYLYDCSSEFKLNAAKNKGSIANSSALMNSLVVGARFKFST